MNLMNNTSLTTAERDHGLENDVVATEPARVDSVARAPTKSAVAALDLDEIHFQALLRLGHDRRRYPSEK